MNGFLTIVDVIGAKLATIACLFVFLKYIFMRLRFQRMNAFFQKVHRPAVYCLLAFGFLHGVASLRVFRETPWFVYLLGLLFFCMVICTTTVYLRKNIHDEAARLKRHRRLALLTLFFFSVHLIFGFWAYFQL